MEGDAPFDAMLSLNMVHIAPWGAALGTPCRRGAPLATGRGSLLLRALHAGWDTRAASNAAFDADLKRWDPRWGVRDVDDLVGEAVTHGLALREVVAMPANNLSLVFVKAGPVVPA